MINLYDLGQVYIVCGRTDMRRGIYGLLKMNLIWILFLAESLSSAVAAATVSRLYIGMVRDIGCFIKDLKMAR